MNIVKILIMGDRCWIENFQKNIISLSSSLYMIESISNSEEAFSRLQHNSYDVLILDDKFFGKNSIKLATMAYAMSRPTLIICNNIFSFIKYKLQKIFSTFFQRYQISRKLIKFHLNNKNALCKIIYLAQNYKEISKNVTKEISKITNI